jgi:hypothetical protein
VTAIDSVRHAALALALAGLPIETFANPPCAEGWFSVRARIVRIEPPQAVVNVRPPVGSMRPAGLGAVLCSGDTIENTTASRVVVLEAGRSIEVTSLSYQVGARPAVATAAANYVAGVMELVGGLRPPVPRAMPTATRGAGEALMRYERIRPILPLRDLPRQRLTDSQNVLVAWRDGVAPYRCLGFAEDTTLNWQSATTALGWCEPRQSFDRTVRMTVEDGRGLSTGWNTESATWDDVPRPPWNPNLAPEPSSAERVAWAIWLWRKAGREWRLQAMSMLNALSATEPLAADLLDRIIDENLPVE